MNETSFHPPAIKAVARVNVTAWLLVVALLVRALIPVGFMPGTSAGTLFPLVICSGSSGTSTVYVPAAKLPGQPEAPQKHSDGANAPCAFSASLAFGVISHPVPVAAAGMISRADAFPLTEEGAADSVPKPFFSQGPPVIS